MSIEILKKNKIEDIKGIHLFGSNGSNNTLRAMLLLEEKGLTWETHSVNLASFEQFETEYLALNPQGSIPALIHDGVPVYGSENILKYLSKVFPDNSMTSNNETEMWEWVESATRTHIETGVAYLYSKHGGRPARLDMLPKYKDYNYEKYLFLIERGHHMTDTQIEESMSIIHAKLLMLDQQISNRAYMFGKNVSIADLAWFADVLFITNIGFNISMYPNVVNWMERMKARPSYNKRTKSSKLVFNLLTPFLGLLANKSNYLK